MAIDARSSVWLVSVVLLASCGPGDDQLKADKAVARMQNRPKPGYARVLNLTSMPVIASVQGRIIAAPAPPNTATRMVPVGTGSQEIVIKAEGAPDVKVQTQLTSNQGTTIVLLPNRTTSQVPGEPRTPDADRNVRLVFLDEKGQKLQSGPAVTVNGPTPKTFKPSDDAGSLDLGSWSVNGETVTLAKDIAYSFVFIKHGSGYKAFLLQNNNREKPVSAGQSAS